jgi:hypothetical protein
MQVVGKSALPAPYLPVLRVERADPGEVALPQAAPTPLDHMRAPVERMIARELAEDACAGPALCVLHGLKNRLGDKWERSQRWWQRGWHYVRCCRKNLRVLMCMSVVGRHLVVVVHLYKELT